MVVHPGSIRLDLDVQPRDEIRVDRFALDPLRQANHVALLRMGHAAPESTVMQLARRKGWFRSDWMEFPRPMEWADALSRVSSGTMPSNLLDLTGAPTHIMQL